MAKRRNNEALLTKFHLEEENTETETGMSIILNTNHINLTLIKTAPLKRFSCHFSMCIYF